MVKRPVLFTARRASATMTAAAATDSDWASGSTATDDPVGVVSMSGRILERPVGMEDALPIDTPVCVGAEVVALGLDQIRR